MAVFESIMLVLIFLLIAGLYGIGIYVVNKAKKLKGNAVGVFINAILPGMFKVGAQNENLNVQYY